MFVCSLQIINKIGPRGPEFILEFFANKLNKLLADQKIVGNSLQLIGVILTGNLFIRAPSMLRVTIDAIGQCG